MTRRTTQRETRAEAIARADRTRSELDAYHLAAQYWQRGEAPAFERSFDAGPAVVRIQGYGLERFDGGIVVEAWTYDGETTSAHVHPALTWIASVEHASRLGIVDYQRADAASALRYAQRVAAETRYGVKADTSEAPKR